MNIYVVTEDLCPLGVFNSIEAANNYILNLIRVREKVLDVTISKDYMDYNDDPYVLRHYLDNFADYYIRPFILNKQDLEEA